MNPPSIHTSYNHTEQHNGIVNDTSVYPRSFTKYVKRNRNDVSYVTKEGRRRNGIINYVTKEEMNPPSMHTMHHLTEQHGVINDIPSYPTNYTKYVKRARTDHINYVTKDGGRNGIINYVTKEGIVKNVRRILEIDETKSRPHQQPQYPTKYERADGIIRKKNFYDTPIKEELHAVPPNIPKLGRRRRSGIINYVTKDGIIFESYGERRKCSHHPEKRKRRIRSNLMKPGSQLYQFMLQLLEDESKQDYITWVDPSIRVFRILKKEQVAQMWGKSKNRPMTYASLSRGLRHYYDQGLLKPVNKKLHYQFTKKAFEQWDNIRNNNDESTSSVK